MKPVSIRVRCILAWYAMTNPEVLIGLVTQMSVGLMKSILDAMQDVAKQPPVTIPPDHVAVSKAPAGGGGSGRAIEGYLLGHESGKGKHTLHIGLLEWTDHTYDWYKSVHEDPQGRVTLVAKGGE